MLKKIFYISGTLLLIVSIVWEYKVNILIWAIPTLMNIANPVQENIPTNWSSGPSEIQKRTDERPNIILILADDMGYNDISLHNGGAADGSLKTPNIDSLAQSGAWFSRGYAANATCAPSRASIMSGKYPTRFGYEFTPVPDASRFIVSWLVEEDDPVLRARIDSELANSLPSFMEMGMPTEQITIAEVLRDAGYYTAHIGKWHLGHAYGMDPQSQGFEDSLTLAGSSYLPENDPKVINAKFDTNIDKMVWTSSQYAARFNGGDLFKPDKYVTDYYTDEALKVIEKNQNRPFFLYLSHWAIHNPLQALRSDVEQMTHMPDHNLQVYSGMIASLDRGVGKVIDKLKELKIYGKTLIIFTSDNGGANYIELEDINKPYRGWKLNHFEGGLHIPFMAKWPTEIKPGTIFDHPIHQNDIFSTFAAAADASIPNDRIIDGKNIIPFIKENKPPHGTLFWRSGRLQTVLHDEWKMIVDKNQNKKWLFDLSNDPTERNNLVDQMSEKVEILEKILEEHHSQQVEPNFMSVIATPVRLDKHDGEEWTEDDEYTFWDN